MNIKPFKCNVCGKFFREKGSVKTHIKLHTRDVDGNSVENCPDDFMIDEDQGSIDFKIGEKDDKKNLEILDPINCNVKERNKNKIMDIPQIYSIIEENQTSLDEKINKLFDFRSLNPFYTMDNLVNNIQADNQEELNLTFNND